MGIKNRIVKFSRVILVIVTALIVKTDSVFCEESQIGINVEFPDTDYKRYFNEFQSAFGKQIEEEFGLKWIEGGVLHNFSSNDIEFYAYRRATLEEARALELSVLNKLDKAIQADSKILSYLNKLSLTPESIGIDIRFVNLHNWSYEDGSIDTIYFKYSKKDKKRYLWYTTTDPFSDYSAEKDEAFRTNFEESFEDALKLNTAISIVNPAIHNPTGFEVELDRILTSFKEEMKEKRILLFRSSGWTVAGNFTPDISEIRTKCTHKYPVDCQEARALMLLTTEKLLTALNNSETLRPYLKEYPFPASRLKLRILFRKEKFLVGDEPYYDGSMESAVLSGNTITYYHHIPNIQESGLHEKVVYAQESYQEAQKTFENTPPLTLLEKITKGTHMLIFNFSHFSDLTVSIFFLALLFIICTGGWFIIPVIIIFFLYLRNLSSQHD